jgi:hypothetical protein
MDDFTPAPEFEKKVQAAASAPSASPKFVSRLREQVIAAAVVSDDQPLRRQNQPDQYKNIGNKIMRTRIMLPALVAVIAIAVVAFFTFNTATNVSAQQILDRATAAQSASASAPANGIWHVRIVTEHNYQALGQNTPATKITGDTYEATGQYRYVAVDASGKITEASSNDGSYNYSTKVPAGSPLTIYRSPVTQDQSRKIVLSGASNYTTKAVFDQFESNPRVRMEGKVTWTDGSQAYVLVNDNYQTQKTAGGQASQTYTGSMKMVFNARTYELLEMELSIYKDGKNIVVDSSRWLVDEVLPAGSKVAWDLSDLPGGTVVNEVPAVQDVQSSAPVFEKFSIDTLVARTHTAYVLKTLPAGFTLEIGAVKDQPKDQPYAYEVNYSGPNGATFDIMAIGLTDLGFIKSNFYDGSYQSAAGLVLYFSTASRSNSTSAILTTPEGNSFLLGSALPREQVEALVETLVPAK